MFFKPLNKLFLTDSLGFLKSLEGKKISEISRIVEGGVSRYLKDFKNFAESDVFEFCSGPVFLTFDCGLRVGFGDSPKDQSIVVWEQKGGVVPIQVIGEETFEEGDIFIDSNNLRYASKAMSSFAGSEISGISIMKVRNSEIAQRRFRNERGLTISTLDGRNLFFSIQMNQGAPGHFIVTTKMDIRTELVDNLENIKV